MPQFTLNLELCAPVFPKCGNHVFADENGDEGLSNYPQTARKQIVIIVRDLNDNPPQLRYGDEEAGRAFSIDFPELSSRPIIRDFVVTDPDSKPSPPNFQPKLEVFSDPTCANHVSVVRIDVNKIRLTILKAFDYDYIQQLNFTLVVHDDDPKILPSSQC